MRLTGSRALHGYVLVCLFFLRAFRFLRTLHAFIFLRGLRAFMFLSILCALIFYERTCLKLTHVNENLSTFIKYFHFFKTCVILCMSFSFFETKNINHFKYWREHLTFWQTGTLSGTTISHKDYWDSLYFHEKFLKNVRLAQRYPEFPLPPPPHTLVQCSAKSGKTIPGSGGQEWPSKFPINIK